jgi:phage terminase large subunit-like protein
VVDYGYVADHLAALCESHDVRRIAFDAWNFRHLRPYLERVGFREDQLDGDGAIFVPMRQGFQTMSPALRDLEAAMLEGRLRHGMHPVLEMCAANAVVVSDPAGNRKLAKNKSRGRIDGMVALAMALSAAVDDREEEGSMDDFFAALAGSAK